MTAGQQHGQVGPDTPDVVSQFLAGQSRYDGIREKQVNLVPVQFKQLCSG